MTGNPLTFFYSEALTHEVMKFILSIANTLSDAICSSFTCSCKLLTSSSYLQAQYQGSVSITAPSLLLDLSASSQSEL